MAAAKSLEALIAEASALRDEIAGHRRTISELGARRRQVVAKIAERIGPSEAARRLGIARQTVHEILHPDVPRERKARLRARQSETG